MVEIPREPRHRKAAARRMARRRCRMRRMADRARHATRRALDGVRESSHSLPPHFQKLPNRSHLGDTQYHALSGRSPGHPHQERNCMSAIDSRGSRTCRASSPTGAPFARTRCRCFDVGGTSVRAGLYAPERGNLVAARRVPTPNVGRERATEPRVLHRPSWRDTP